MKNISKTEALKEIGGFFKDIKVKSPKEVRKIKKLAMRYNIPLREKRRLFCKKCYSVYRKPKIRIQSGIKSVWCEECGFVSRWKIS